MQRIIYFEESGIAQFGSSFGVLQVMKYRGKVQIRCNYTSSGHVAQDGMTIHREPTICLPPSARFRDSFESGLYQFLRAHSALHLVLSFMLRLRSTLISTLIP